MVVDTKAPLGQVQEPVITTATNKPAIKEPATTIKISNQAIRELVRYLNIKEPEPEDRCNRGLWYFKQTQSNLRTMKNITFSPPAVAEGIENTNIVSPCL